MIRSRGFTLVEMLTVMTVMAVSAAVVFPVVTTLLVRFEDSADRRSQAIDAHLALDQITATVRAWPSTTGQLDGLLVMRNAGEVTGLELPGAGGFRLVGDQLQLINEAGQTGVLAEGITGLQVIGHNAQAGAPLDTDPEWLDLVTLGLVIELDATQARGMVHVRTMGRGM